ncbi:glutathione S-transferase family protein [Agrobacterium sp. rho-13.3]|uniref:glutathione S-transferase family protein n=1 Tax=Agrobacterium sp. rho-13.3 TaxID=3072980 RepID=UPI002A135294|nr:glutathione S-transferase family protein [Agrobacterium sp. rho-13.3]MDX8311818.1 glutathione S-transferase family protein [Agrobacterium sp. rho-13.3]
MTMTFYTNPNSRGRMVRWMLEEVGCAYETVVLDYTPSSQTDKWGGAALARPDVANPRDERVRFFNEINPIGKVPAIEHDGRTVTETAAICAYLADVFPSAGLAPMSDQRANYYRWMFFAAGPLEQAVTNYRAGFSPAPEQEFFFGYGSYERTVDQLERAVMANPYVAGDRFTAADVYVGSHIGWGLGLRTLPPREAFLSYAGRLITRDAYKRAAAKDEELLAQIDLQSR